jgi:hypothetical protein
MAKAILDIWETNKTIIEFSTINKERVEGLSNLVNYFKSSTATILRRAKLDLPVVTKVVLLPTKDELNSLTKALKAFTLSIMTMGQY